MQQAVRVVQVLHIKFPYKLINIYTKIFFMILFKIARQKKDIAFTQFYQTIHLLRFEKSLPQ